MKTYLYIFQDMFDCEFYVTVDSALSLEDIKLEVEERMLMYMCKLKEIIEV